MLPVLRFGQRATFPVLSHFCPRVYASRGLCNTEHPGDDEIFKDDLERFNLYGISKEDLEKLDLYGLRPESFIRGSIDAVDVDDYDEKMDNSSIVSSRYRFFDNIRLEADRVFQLLQQDGLGFDFRSELGTMQVKVTNILVREVLLRIRKSINDVNRSRYARLAYKFFSWAGEQEGYSHNANGYNLTLKIFSECNEFRAMWRLVDEMIQNGFPVTARTFNLLICACGEAGLRRRLVARFLKSKTFSYRPFKHSYNAILHALVSLNQYRLIEWVYQQMLLDGHSPDVFTYNVLMCAKFRLGKLDEFHRLLDEMGQNGLAPDLHTYNLLLHVLGKGDKPLAALNLLNYMAEVGCHPRVLHYTTLIDGLSRAGNLEASQYFFDEMVKKGHEPDVVSYTVMITGYVVAGELEKAQKIYHDMVIKGQLPNVFTYNSMIRGLCVSGKFDEACSMLKDMESRGCIPNFSVYSTLVGRLRSSGKVLAAQKIISDMLEKGRYIHLLSRFRGYRRV